MPPQGVEENPSLGELARRISEDEPPDPDLEPFDAESSELAALSARLLPATISPKGNGWRFVLPKELPAEEAASGQKHVHLLFSQGYLEIWSTQCLEQAIGVDLHKLLG